MQFTLRQLSYFKALCTHRNFGRAAEASHVSQPALSVQIKALEETMGGPLVERRSRDILLTPLGRQVLAQAEEVLQSASGLSQIARDQEAGHRSLSLGLIPTLAPYLLPKTLSVLRARDLQVSVQITEARTERLLNALQEGRLDAAVVALPSGIEGLTEVPLFEDRFLLAGSTSRLAQLAKRGHVTRPEDLRPEQLMLLEDGHCLSDQALAVCGMNRRDVGINMGAGSLATLSRLVAAGFGYTLMPELAAKSECATVEGLALQRFPMPEPARQIGLVRRQSTPAGHWFEPLAEIISAAGQEIVDEAQRDF